MQYGFGPGIDLDFACRRHVDISIGSEIHIRSRIDGNLAIIREFQETATGMHPPRFAGLEQGQVGE